EQVRRDAGARELREDEARKLAVDQRMRRQVDQKAPAAALERADLRRELLRARADDPAAERAQELMALGGLEAPLRPGQLSAGGAKPEQHLPADEPAGAAQRDDRLRLQLELIAAERLLQRGGGERPVALLDRERVAFARTPQPAAAESLRVLASELGRGEQMA